MTAHLPANSPHLRLLDDILIRTAAQAGFETASVLVEDGARGVFIPLPQNGSQSSSLRVLPEDPLVRRALASAEPIVASDRALTHVSPHEPDFARVVLLRVSDPGSSPVRLLLLGDSRLGVEFTTQQSTALLALRTLVDSAALTVLDAEEQRRRRRDLEHGRLLADERAAVVERG